MRRSSSCCSPVSIITSPPTMTTRSASDRVLFDAPRQARAYIDRAQCLPSVNVNQKSLQHGVEASAATATRRAFVQAAIDGGPRRTRRCRPERLNCLDPVLSTAPLETRARLARAGPGGRTAPAGWSRPFIGLIRVRAGAAVAFGRVWGPLDWPASFPLQRATTRVSGGVVRDSGLTLPRRGELALARARAQTADGHLRDALVTLDTVRPTDPEKGEADRLRGEIQLQMLALTPVPQPTAADPDRADRGQPPGQ